MVLKFHELEYGKLDLQKIKFKKSDRFQNIF